MDENQQDTVKSKLRANVDKLWLPPLSIEDQEKLDRLREEYRIESNEKPENTNAELLETRLALFIQQLYHCMEQRAN